MPLPERSRRLASAGRTLLLVATAAATLGLSGCVNHGLFGRDPDTILPDDADFIRGTPVDVPAFDMLWERARQTLRSEAFPIDQERTSYGQRSMVSRWRTRPAPIRFEGQRLRVHVELVELSKNKYSVGVAVQHQRNEDISSPLNLANAEWVEQPSDEDRARIYLWKIESYFRENQLEFDDDDE